MSGNITLCEKKTEVYCVVLAAVISHCLLCYIFCVQVCLNVRTGAVQLS